MPVRVKAGGVALSMAVGLAAIGCNATCIRDSDCLGRSICSENRCILLVGRDSGRTSSPDDTNDDVPNESDASTTAGDAGD